MYNDTATNKVSDSHKELQISNVKKNIYIGQWYLHEYLSLLYWCIYHGTTHVYVHIGEYIYIICVGYIYSTSHSYVSTIYPLYTPSWYENQW